MAGYQPIDRMQIVDCLLPGQVRRSGRVSFMGPSISTRSTAEACAMRGGEYVDYDRATIDASTRVWMTQAKAGDAQAQYYLGQIYERETEWRATKPERSASIAKRWASAATTSSA